MQPEPPSTRGSCPSRACAGTVGLRGCFHPTPTLGLPLLPSEACSPRGLRREPDNAILQGLRAHPGCAGHAAHTCPRQGPGA